MSMHTATYYYSYGDDYWDLFKRYNEYPVVFENFKIDEEHWATFILADEARVRLVNPPHPELVGVEGKWGELRKRLHYLAVRPVNFTLEIIGIGGYYWLCIPLQITDGVNELRNKISRRNLLIRDLREKAGIS